METGNNFRPHRVVVHGLPHFCRKLSELLKCDGWDVRYHDPARRAGLAALANDLRRCDLAFTWGGRIDLGKFLWSARVLGKKKLLMLWSGSDVLYAKEDRIAGKMDPWILDKMHWAVSPWLAEEVRSLGLACEYVQTSFVEPVNNPPPIPEKFSVLVYLPSFEKAALYGWDQVLEVAALCRCMEFVLVGLRDEQIQGAPPNVKIHGWAANLVPFLDAAAVLWRPVQHDGLSFMVLEAMARGRHVLYSYAFPGCTQVTSAATARKELERLLDLHNSGSLGLNQAGIDAVARDFRQDKVRSDILRRWEKIIRLPNGLSSAELAERSTGA